MVDRDGVLAYNAVRCRCQAAAASWFVRVRVRGCERLVFNGCGAGGKTDGSFARAHVPANHTTIL